MKMKHAALVLAVAGLLSTQAYASKTEVKDLQDKQLQPVAAFTEADLESLFSNGSQPMQLAALSRQEMVETEGAFGPWGAVGGGIIGGIGYAGHALGSGSWDWGSFGYAVGGGALTGFSGGAAAWYAVPRVAFLGGVGAGLMDW